MDAKTDPDNGASLDDDGFGSLPITPTDLGRSKVLSLARRPEAETDKDSDSLAADDGIYTSSEETISSAAVRRSCESVSDAGDPDRASVASSVSEEGGAKISQVSKVCSGSVSRGLEKFKKGKDLNPDSS